MDQHRLARREGAAGSQSVVRGHEDLGNRGCRVVIQPVGHGNEIRLVHQDAIGEATTGDESHDALARLPPRHVASYGNHVPGDLQTWNVRGRPGRCGVVAVSLQQVCRIEAGEPCSYEHLGPLRHRIGTFHDPDHFVAPGSVEYDRTHALFSSGVTTPLSRARSHGCDATSSQGAIRRHRASAYFRLRPDDTSSIGPPPVHRRPRDLRNIPVCAGVVPQVDVPHVTDRVRPPASAF